MAETTDDRLARLEERMAAIEHAHKTHEEHCYQFRNDTRTEIGIIRSTLARWSIVMGLVTIAANAAAATAVVYLVAHLLKRI